MSIDSAQNNIYTQEQLAEWKNGIERFKALSLEIDDSFSEQGLHTIAMLLLGEKPVWITTQRISKKAQSTLEKYGLKIHSKFDKLLHLTGSFVCVYNPDTLNKTLNKYSALFLGRGILPKSESVLKTVLHTTAADNSHNELLGILLGFPASASKYFDTYTGKSLLFFKYEDKLVKLLPDTIAEYMYNKSVGLKYDESIKLGDVLAIINPIIKEHPEILQDGDTVDDLLNSTKNFLYWHGFGIGGFSWADNKDSQESIEKEQRLIDVLALLNQQ